MGGGGGETGEREKGQVERGSLSHTTNFKKRIC